MMTIDSRFRRPAARSLTTASVLFLLTACGSAPMKPLPDDPPAPPVPACENGALTDYASLLVMAPHPDDEILGFAGLADAYRRQGKTVRTIVVTDGDAYCGACALWSTGDTKGTPCDAADLSNFDTPAVDSFAEVRRQESARAAAILGAPAPDFLGYPDTGIGAAWRNHEAGTADAPLHRSDFSGCEICGECDHPSQGFGAGPSTNLTANTLETSIRQALDAAGEGALIATTHWLDDHGDHAALGEFVRAANAHMDRPRTLAFAVIHAHTPNGYEFPDCWYPAPAAVECPCMDPGAFGDDPERLQALRDYRRQPDWPQRLPDDADYGPPAQLCLSAELTGRDALKPRAIAAFESQLGTRDRDGAPAPPERDGILDCNGYLTSFGRMTEVFVLQPANAAAGDQAPSR